MKRWIRARSLARSLPLLLALASPAVAAENLLSVTLTGMVGTPADSSERREFMDAFRAAMDADLPCEQRSGDAWTSAGPRRNPFRLVDAAPPGSAWTLELSIGVPPEIRVRRPKPKDSNVAPRPRVTNVRASRGITIAAAALSPSAAAAGEPAVPLRVAAYFADARRVLVPSSKVPGGGYDYPWADAGRVVARVALEALHRANGLLAADERADLAPATRAESAP